ncbi:hypothetical protein [Salipaludibacillus sp. CF4.18]
MVDQKKEPSEEVKRRLVVFLSTCESLKNIAREREEDLKNA